MGGVMPMSRKAVLPDDVRKMCIQIVRGYDRRVRNYNNRRQEIINGTPCHHEIIKDPNDPDDLEKTSWVYQPVSHNASRTTEGIASRILGLEEQPETKRMRAVERAKLQIGIDLPEELRKKLTEAVILNCKSGRRYPYTCFYLPGIEKTNFYDRRSDFLYSIAEYLEMV